MYMNTCALCMWLAALQAITAVPLSQGHWRIWGKAILIGLEMSEKQNFQ